MTPILSALFTAALILGSFLGVWFVLAFTVGIGLLSMYLAKTQALSLKTEKKEAEDELKQIKAGETTKGE